MLDLRFIRNHPDVVRRALERRNEAFPLDDLLSADEEWRTNLARLEQLKAQRNEASEAIGRLKREGKDADEAIAQMREVGQEISTLDARVKELESQIQELLLVVPNIPHDSVPEGAAEEDNVEVRRWGTPPEFPNGPKAHWDIATDLNIVDFERAGKVAGARFAFLRGAGARLERALINFMIDLHTEEHGYIEVWPPFIANSESLHGTAQLPKFGEDMFRLEGTDSYLIPTAEVPVTNLHRGEILSGDMLPLKYVAYSACFRAEAGAHGRDTRGLIRQHQFNKVELVHFVRPEDSYDALEGLLRDAETVLQRLELPYRVVEICTGDLGFKEAKKYDPEVWMPSYGRYVEISSCSNFEDFQARRADIRFRPEPGAKVEFVHTLNGSGLAVGRTVAAILENYQQPDGSVVVPTALRPYMGMDRIEAGSK